MKLPLTPALLFASASTLLGTQDTPVGSVTLPVHFANSVGEPDIRRWDTAFVHYAGYWSHYDHRSGTSAWPFPPTGDCNELAAAADLHDVLSSDPPQPAELFLLWSPAKQAFVRTGIIMHVEPGTLEDLSGARDGRQYVCHTIEGNIGETGCPGGHRLARVWRTLRPGCGDRTIRWMDCEPNSRFGAVAVPKANPALVMRAFDIGVTPDTASGIERAA
jgi:hypothetical protein